MRKSIKRVLKFDIERFLTFGHISTIPQRQIVFGYLSYIVAGTLLLCLPFATRGHVSFLDNLFTITSAVSTTGLGTVGTSSSYTLFGQIIILLMIQLGGIGYMTISSFFMFRMTHHFLRIKKDVMQTSFSMPLGIELKNMLNGIIIFTLIFEIGGAFLLYNAFVDAGADMPLWSAIFHSISSFCTAGFSIYPDSLEQFKTNVSINIIVSVLSYAGAMGFIVMHDLWAKVCNLKYKITFTTKIIVFMTMLITLIGTIQLFFFEPYLAEYSTKDRLMISMFQTMSAMTTVGYNSIPLGGLMSCSLLTLIITMFIGASPSGTGGGLKSTTATAAFAFVKSKLGVERDVTLLNHKLPSFRIDSALTTFVFYISILFGGLYSLVLTENFALIDLLFEASSALGTVGLSTGITPNLSNGGKVIIIILMYVGRIGVLTFGGAMLIRLTKKKKLKPISNDDIAV